MAPRSHHVCEDHGRTTENIVLQFHSRIKRDIILNFDVVSDPHAAGDVDILSQTAAAADTAIRHDVGKVPNLGVVTNFAGLIDISGRMNIEAPGYFSLDVDRVAVLGDGLSGGVQNLENADAVCAIRAGSDAVADAVEEVRALKFERFVLTDCHQFAFGAVRDGDPVDPVDAVRVEDEFPLR